MEQNINHCNFLKLSQIAEKIAIIFQILGVVDSATVWEIKKSAKNNPDKAISLINSVLRTVKKGKKNYGI